MDVKFARAGGITSIRLDVLDLLNFANYSMGYEI